MTTPIICSPSPLTENPSKERFVHRLFDEISPGYDLFNRLASLGWDYGWRRRAIARLQLTPGMRVLDLASGTGDLAILAAQALVPLGLVVACDLSLPMLRRARRKFERMPAARWHTQLAQGRAENLPFSDGAFHAATIAFALRNVSSLTVTFKELHRVVKPGGRISLLEFGRPRNPLLGAGDWLWMTLVIPVLGLLTTGRLWPFLYLRRSIREFMPPEDLLRHLEEAGFVHPQAESLQGGIVRLIHALRPQFPVAP